MKCPTCHAKLLPVQGELFCLQCGQMWTKAEAWSDDALVETSAVRPVQPRPVLALAPVVRDLAVPQSQATGWHRSRLSRGLVMLLVLVSLLATADGWARWYYHDRVYPGVKVAGQMLGGQASAIIPAELKRSLTQDTVQLTIGTTDYTFTAADLGITIDTDRLAAIAKAQGRAVPLALVGVAQTLISQPLPLEYQVHQSTLDGLVAQLAARHSHPAADAQPILVGTTPLVLAEKLGQAVDQARLKESLLLAVRNHQHVTLSMARLAPALTASAYAADIEDARAKLALSLSLKVKTHTIILAAADIASWLSFGEPGSGAHVDAGRVGAYLAAIPGTFDRAATQAAVEGALAAKQPMVYTAATEKNVAAPSIVSGVAVTPTTYSYCLAARDTTDSALVTLASRSKAVLAQTQGWILGGRVKYTAVASGCNFTLWLAAESAMAAFSPACMRQSTCRIGNDLVINAARWDNPPTDWKGSLEDYRTELINHEVGHWLGFDHASCAPGAAADSPMSQVTLTVAGCAPAWHPIPVELQDLKILPGF